MTTSRITSVFIWSMFFIYCGLFVFLCARPQLPASSAWSLLAAWSILCSVYLLIRHKFPVRKGLICSVIISGLFLLSGITVFQPQFLITVCCVFLSTCAVLSTYDARKECGLVFFRNKTGLDLSKSIGIGIAVGLLWGILNYLMMKTNNPVAYGNPVESLLIALNPAILEEIAFRAVFAATCISCWDGYITRYRSFAIWIMMIVPHALVHTVENFRSSVIEGLVSLVMLSLLFGLPFTILQRKRDLLSAMIAHGMVDFIRFMIFGLPI